MFGIFAVEVFQTMYKCCRDTTIGIRELQKVVRKSSLMENGNDLQMLLPCSKASLISFRRWKLWIQLIPS